MTVQLGLVLTVVINREGQASIWSWSLLLSGSAWVWGSHGVAKRYQGLSCSQTVSMMVRILTTAPGIVIAG